MFISAKYYIVIGNNNFIIRKKDNDWENIIDLESYIPNIPPYHHLFDKDKKDYIKDITNQIRQLKIKNATIILPDDSIDLEIDEKILAEFFLQCGVKKIHVNFQCFFLNSDNKKYISISETTRTIVMQYIAYNKSISKKYYYKGYTELDQIILDMKSIHTDCENGMVPVYINNINNDMQRFEAVGNLVSVDDLIANILKYESNFK